MAKPKLALIPASQGTKLYSVLPADGVGDFTFSRNSAATRINKDGLIETVASGVSRLNYPLIDGVVNGCPSHLLEPQRSNLVTYSEDFSNAAWSKFRTTITPNTIISPSGDLVADSFIEDSTNNTHVLRFNYTPNTSNYIFSVFAKSLSGNRRIRLSSSFETSFAIFNIENGTVVSSTGIDSSKIEDYGNGWYKCTVEKANNSISGNFDFRLDNGTTETYQGDGTSGVYIFGAQLEQGSYPTSYIPTSGSAVTRSAETANGAGDASTFNDSEGVLMVDVAAIYKSSAGYDSVSITDGSASNKVQLYFTPAINQLYYIITATTNQAVGFITLNDATSFNKIAIKYKANDFALWSNGYELLTDTSGSTPIGLNTLNFDNGTGSTDFYGNTKQVQYFDSALNDSDLEKITSWTSFTDMANGQTYSIK